MKMIMSYAKFVDAITIKETPWVLKQKRQIYEGESTTNKSMTPKVPRLWRLC